MRLLSRLPRVICLSASLSWGSVSENLMNIKLISHDLRLSCREISFRSVVCFDKEEKSNQKRSFLTAMPRTWWKRYIRNDFIWFALTRLGEFVREAIFSFWSWCFCNLSTLLVVELSGPGEPNSRFRTNYKQPWLVFKRAWRAPQRSEKSLWWMIAYLFLFPLRLPPETHF